MKARTLKLFALAAAAVLPAFSQKVDQILVTQAGLVPEGGYENGSPSAHRSPSDAKGGQGLPQAREAATPDFAPDAGSLEIDSSLIPEAPPQVLSKYEVRDNNAPRLRRRDIYTKQGLEDLSLREHPGLHAGNFRNLNAEEGYEMFLEDERLENIEDFRETAIAMKAGGDASEADVILKASNSAFLRDEYSPEPANGIFDAPLPKSGTLLTNIEQLRLTLIERRF